MRGRLDAAMVTQYNFNCVIDTILTTKRYTILGSIGLYHVLSVCIWMC